MGRSRGGLTTKIHALVDANGLPISLKLIFYSWRRFAPCKLLILFVWRGVFVKV
jgi:hypothetical protein